MQEYKVKVYEDRSEWYQNDKLHRLDGPAVEYASGSKEWFQNGKLHRLDGPAVERANGDKFWYQNGKLHRLDGPAIEYVDGYKEWWIDGRNYSEAEFLKKTTTHTITIDGKDIELSNESFNELKNFFKDD